MPILEKRKAQEMALVAAKRQRNELVAVASQERQLLHAVSGPPRTSSLQAPIMLLSGHEGEIYAAKFHPEGNLLASGSFDRNIFLWNVYGDCENYAVLNGHSGAIMELQFSTDGSTLFSASTDKTVGLFDMETGTRIKRLKGHSTFVNSCHPSRRGPQMVVSGSDDSTIRLWDTRKKGSAQTFQNTYQVTSVSFNDTSDQILSGGIDNDIKCWDLRKNDVIYKMRGHMDTVTGLSLSKDGSYLLSCAMDNTAMVDGFGACRAKHMVSLGTGVLVRHVVAAVRRRYAIESTPLSVSDQHASPVMCSVHHQAFLHVLLRIWDVRPFAPQERCVKIFQGNQHSFEKNLIRCNWSPDGSKVTAGSADRFVYVWDTTSRRILYKLPGHDGSINEVDFHPYEPIVLSASSDKKIYLGEIQ
ncbi:SNRNP40 [Branchiostoma lanceolatum]|uniref:SNRNP40 protein n=1 Tax=Branchiostoma lanceolatum TaxID=7740 RepID=A0A8K0EF80_BRALA|nr:SNRNP40 [Branchiostoma lanceolatum]